MHDIIFHDESFLKELVNFCLSFV